MFLISDVWGNTDQRFEFYVYFDNFSSYAFMDINQVFGFFCSQSHWEFINVFDFCSDKKLNFVHFIANDYLDYIAGFSVEE